MLCCLVIAALLGPIGLWAISGVRRGGEADCCAGSRRRLFIIAGAVILAAALCLAAFVLWAPEPTSFRHMCRFIAGS